MPLTQRFPHFFGRKYNLEGFIYERLTLSTLPQKVTERLTLSTLPQKVTERLTLLTLPQKVTEK